MTPPDCNEAARLITALVDGELQVDEVGRIRGHLERCPDCAARHRMEARLKAFLTARAADVQAPPDLGARVRAALSREAMPPMPRPAAVETLAQRVRSRWLPLSVIAAAMVGMTVMWINLEVRNAGRGASPFQETLASIHYAATQAGIFQVRTQDPDELAAWLTAHVGHPVTVPVLEGLGLTPAGGRVVEIDGKPVAMALYRDYEGDQPDLTVMAAGPEVNWPPEGWRTAVEGGRTVQHARIRGEDMALFRTGDTLWMLVSTCGEEGMSHAAEAVAMSLASPDVEPAAAIR
jgi:anti-sigma factor (TIGR02949 family)